MVICCSLFLGFVKWRLMNLMLLFLICFRILFDFVIWVYFFLMMIGVFSFLCVWFCFGLRLDGVEVCFVGMDMDDFFDIGYEDFFVVDMVGLCCFVDCFDDGFCIFVCKYYFDFYFWEKIDDIFGVVIEFCMVFLMVKVFGFGYSDFL